ncbi:GyrI-like domain-containing protein [Clostridium sp.]|uniref:GyrI-like domain-containing protein n=1 Tax=Clostridium sp. TaxID=1506 RepID=UPI0032164947
MLNLNNTSEERVFGISIYSGSDEVYYYIATETDKPVQQGMYEFEIPTTMWAVFENNGPFKESIQNIYKRFFTEWLPFSGYQHSEIADIEVYPGTCKESSSGYSEIWMSIKKERNN